MDSTSRTARFEPAVGSCGALVVTDLTITENTVLREARHWTSGRRGEPCDISHELAQADLSPFVIEAVVLGARALAATAQTNEARAVEQMLREVGEKTTEATAAASASTRQAVIDATSTVVRAAAAAKKAITEADEQSRRELTAAVEGAKRDLNSEIRRVLGGERPELVERLQPLLDSFGAGLEAKVQASTGVLLDKVARQFDPADPTSPMAKHTATLKLQQEALAAQIGKNHSELTAKVDELATAMRVSDARASLAKVTPIKGGSFEDQIHDLMDGVAAGLGEEYVDTGSTVGYVPRSKKGDGVLSVAGGTARVVLEMTDSARTGWGDYAAHRRDAAPSCGDHGHRANRCR